jgi:hypothetical protein
MADNFPQIDWRSGQPENLFLDDGFAGSLMEQELIGGAPVGRVRAWTGAAWVACRAWTGTQWQLVKAWTGAAWV